MKDENKFSKLYEEITTIRQLLEISVKDNSKTQKIIEIYAKDAIIKEIEKVASTKPRKMAWNLLDSKLSTSEIATKIKISQRAVNDFIKDLRENGLVLTLKRGYYKRKFNYLLSEQK